MNSGDNSGDPVAEQYDRWVYPQPIDDIAAWAAAGHQQAADPKLMADEYWPDRGYRDGLEILVAGCGANQAAAIAYSNPSAQVVGTDVSASSLEHGKRLKKQHGLDNLELHELPVEQSASLDRGFDLVVATGVLHHLADPAEGLNALAGVLKADGVIFLMLYARYGRAGAYMLQDFFRRLGVDQSPEDVALVKATLEALNPRHPVRVAGEKSPDHEYEAGLVDLYLHRRDVAYTVPDCLDLLQRSGLVFQGWYQRNHYYPEGQVPTSHPLFPKLQALAEPELWAAMELFDGTITKHAFFACRPERDEFAWRLGIDEDTVFDLVPLLRGGAELHPPGSAGDGAIQRQGFEPVTLNKAQLALLGQVDGRRSVGQCAEAGRLTGDENMLRGFAAQLVRSLWRTDYLSLRLPSASPN